MTDRREEPPRFAADANVAVVVPFAGVASAARRVAERLGRLAGDGVDCILVDNTPGRVASAVELAQGVRVFHAAEMRSSYYARNIGAEQTTAPWILFVDSDCDPPPDLVERYLRADPEPGVGALAGELRQPDDEAGLTADWARSRSILSQRHAIAADPPAAVSANLMLRREAFESVGGFCEGIRSGGDIELCWRLADAGWRIELVEDAVVEHPARASVGTLWRQFARYGAGNAWQRRRYPDRAPDRVGAGPVTRRLAVAAALLVTARPRRAAMATLDALSLVARAWGSLLDNAAPREAPPGVGSDRGLAVVTDLYPALSETFVEADVRGLAERGWAVRVEALARPARPRLGGVRGLTVNYLEDEGFLSRARATVRVVVRHPLRCLADLRVRRRFDPRERLPLRAITPMVERLELDREDRVHAHFGALASVIALRAARIAGIPASIAFHGHEIYRDPKALPQKLAAADVVVTACDYTVADLRSQMSDGDRDRVHRVVVGVDPERFRRRHEYPRGSTVVAVGRLVEKKGFAYLVEAVASLEREGRAPERVVIAGDGPLRSDLEALRARLGVEALVELPGALEPERVRELLEEAAVFCLPSVVAADGDRDSMPVVVKEAMAMEVPVIVSREVGLPELVEEGWGRLVEPRDAEGLAAAIGELLELGHERRRELGRAGREAVKERANLSRETDRLSRLLADGAA